MQADAAMRARWLAAAGCSWLDTIAQDGDETPGAEEGQRGKGERGKRARERGKGRRQLVGRRIATGKKRKGREERGKGKEREEREVSSFSGNVRESRAFWIGEKKRNNLAKILLRSL